MHAVSTHCWHPIGAALGVHGAFCEALNGIKGMSGPILAVRTLYPEEYRRLPTPGK